MGAYRARKRSIIASTPSPTAPTTDRGVSSLEPWMRCLESAARRKRHRHLPRDSRNRGTLARSISRRAPRQDLAAISSSHAQQTHTCITRVTPQRMAHPQDTDMRLGTCPDMHHNIHLIHPIHHKLSTRAPETSTFPRLAPAAHALPPLHRLLPHAAHPRHQLALLSRHQLTNCWECRRRRSPHSQSAL